MSIPLTGTVNLMGILIQVEGIGKYVNTSDRYSEFNGHSHPGGRDWNISQLLWAVLWIWWVFSSRWKGLGNISTSLTGTVNLMGLLIQVEGIGKHVNTSDRYYEFDGYSHPGGRDWEICKHFWEVQWIWWVFSSRWKGLGNMSTPLTATVNLMILLIHVEGIEKYVNTYERYSEFDGYSHPSERDWEICQLLWQILWVWWFFHPGGRDWKICHLLWQLLWIWWFFHQVEGFGKKCDLVTLNPYFCRGEYWRILAPGRYRLRASLYGSDYATAWKDVEVGPGLQPRVDFVMEKARLSGSSNNLSMFLPFTSIDYYLP
jgi:hypothetical protein